MSNASVSISLTNGQISAQQVTHQHRRHGQVAVSQLCRHRVEIAEERFEGVPAGGGGEAMAPQVEGHHVVVTSQLKA